MYVKGSISTDRTAPRLHGELGVHMGGSFPCMARNAMSDTTHRHAKHGRHERDPHKRLSRSVDIPAATGYHLYMPLRADPDLADRPDPERQPPTAGIPRRAAQSRHPLLARLSIPPAAVQLTTTDRPPSSFSRHRARTAPPSVPAIASALATQRLSAERGAAGAPPPTGRRPDGASR
jgi:hypothetical protein